MFVFVLSKRRHAAGSPRRSHNRVVRRPPFKCTLSPGIQTCCSHVVISHVHHLKTFNWLDALWQTTQVCHRDCSLVTRCSFGIKVWASCLLPIFIAQQVPCVLLLLTLNMLLYYKVNLYIKEQPNCSWISVFNSPTVFCFLLMLLQSVSVHCDTANECG